MDIKLNHLRNDVANIKESILKIKSAFDSQAKNALGGTFKEVAFELHVSEQTLLEISKFVESYSSNLNPNMEYGLLRFTCDYTNVHNNHLMLHGDINIV
jgi:hypothetical protein